MNEEEYPESFLSTTLRRVEGRELQWGRNMHMRSQEIKKVKEGKAHRKGRNAESIMSSVSGIMRVKCLQYFKVKVSKKTYQSRFQKK